MSTKAFDWIPSTRRRSSVAVFNVLLLSDFAIFVLLTTDKIEQIKLSMVRDSEESEFAMIHSDKEEDLLDKETEDFILVEERCQQISDRHVGTEISATCVADTGGRHRRCGGELLATTAGDRVGSRGASESTKASGSNAKRALSRLVVKIAE